MFNLLSLVLFQGFVKGKGCPVPEKVSSLAPPCPQPVQSALLIATRDAKGRGTNGVFGAGLSQWNLSASAPTKGRTDFCHIFTSDATEFRKPSMQPAPAPLSLYILISLSAGR